MVEPYADEQTCKTIEYQGPCVHNTHMEIVLKLVGKFGKTSIDKHNGKSIESVS